MFGDLSYPSSIFNGERDIPNSIITFLIWMQHVQLAV